MISFPEAAIGATLLLLRFDSAAAYVGWQMVIRVVIYWLLLLGLAAPARSQSGAPFKQGDFIGVDETATLPAGIRSLNDLQSSRTATAIIYSKVDGKTGIAYRLYSDLQFKVVIEDGDSRLAGSKLGKRDNVDGYNLTIGEKAVYFSTSDHKSSWRFLLTLGQIEKVTASGDTVQLTNTGAARVTYASTVFPKPGDGREFLYLEADGSKPYHGLFEIKGNTFDIVVLDENPSWVGGVPNYDTLRGVGFDQNSLLVLYTKPGFNSEGRRINLSTRAFSLFATATPDGWDSFLGDQKSAVGLGSFIIGTDGLTYICFGADGDTFPDSLVMWDGSTWYTLFSTAPAGTPVNDRPILTAAGASTSFKGVGVQYSGEYSSKTMRVIDSTQKILIQDAGGGAWTEWLKQGMTLGDGHVADKLGKFTIFGDAILVSTKRFDYDGPLDRFYRFKLAPKLPAAKVTAVRAASGNAPATTPLAPRAIATVYGTGLNNSTGGIDLTGGATITLCGAQARVLFNSGTQINFILPGTIGAESVCDVVVAVTYPNYPFPIKSNTQRVIIAEKSPTPFMWQPNGADGKPLGGLIPVATDGVTGQVIGPVGVLNTVQAAPGSVVVVWGTGAGNPNNLADTQLSPAAGVRINPPEIRLMTGENTSAPLVVEWAGESGGSIGLAQFNIRLPDRIGAGTNWFSLGGVWYPLSVVEAAPLILPTAQAVNLAQRKRLEN